MAIGTGLRRRHAGHRLLKKSDHLLVGVLPSLHVRHFPRNGGLPN